MGDVDITLGDDEKVKGACEYASYRRKRDRPNDEHFYRPDDEENEFIYCEDPLTFQECKDLEWKGVRGGFVVTYLYKHWHREKTCDEVKALPNYSTLPLKLTEEEAKKEIKEYTADSMNGSGGLQY